MSAIQLFQADKKRVIISASDFSTLEHAFLIDWEQDD